MSTLLVDGIAAHIRRVDGGNRLKRETLAMEIEDYLHDRGVYAVEWNPLAAFLARTNPDKQVGAGRLAELIVAEFALGEER